MSGYPCSVDLFKELLLKLLTMCSKDTADVLSGSIHEDIQMYLTSEGYLSTEHELGCVEIAKLPFEKDSLVTKRNLDNYTKGLLGYALMTSLFNPKKHSSYSFGSFLVNDIVNSENRRKLEKLGFRDSVQLSYLLVSCEGSSFYIHCSELCDALGLRHSNLFYSIERENELIRFVDEVNGFKIIEFNKMNTSRDFFPILNTDIEVVVNNMKILRSRNVN